MNLVAYKELVFLYLFHGVAILTALVILAVAGWLVLFSFSMGRIILSNIWDLRYSPIQRSERRIQREMKRKEAAALRSILGM